MRAVQIRTFGEPGIVLELADLPEPPAPAAGEVLIGVEHAPINMNDLYLIQGVYPVRPSLPSVVGNEGVGRVLAIGRGVDHLKVGDRVLLPLYSFSWRERLVAPAAGLFVLPEAKVRVSSLDRARDAIDLVAATVDAPGLVEHAIFGEDLVDRRAAARGVVFTEDVVKIAGQQGRYAVGHGLPPLGSLLRGRASPRPRRFPDARAGS